MGTHLRVLSESFPMDTNMTGFRLFSYFFAFSCIERFYESKLSIKRVKKTSQILLSAEKKKIIETNT